MRKQQFIEMHIEEATRRGTIKPKKIKIIQISAVKGDVENEIYGLGDNGKMYQWYNRDNGSFWNSF